MKLDLKFKGAKTILFYGEEAKKKKPTIKDFWTKLFGDYKIPVCPLCEKEMELRRVHIERSFYGTGLLAPLPPLPHQGDETIELEFKCPKCKGTIEGFGKDITFDFTNKWFSVEVFGVTKYSVEIDGEK